MSGLAVAQLPTHELISTVVSESIALASILGFSSRTQAVVTAIKVPQPLMPERNNQCLSAFWRPGLPDVYPTQWG